MKKVGLARRSFVYSLPELFFSSSSEGAASAAKEATFVKQRASYRDELTALRKTWAVEIQKRRALEEKTAALEKEKVVLDRAIRLREKRKESVLRQEADKKAKALAEEKYKQHLARNLVVHNQREQEQERVNARFMEELSNEKETWITEENMHELITPALFEGPTSTGLLNKDSDQWRWQLHSMKLDRLSRSDLSSTTDFGGSSLAERLEFRGQIRSTRKIMVQDFLEPMIESGGDRAQYDELVDHFSTKFEDLDVWHKADEVDDFFFDEDNTSSTLSAMAMTASDETESGQATDESEEAEGSEAASKESPKKGQGRPQGRKGGRR
jgi:hypothetical protein